MRRRRECGSCGRRFTTFERVAASVAVVRKRDGRREAFEPEKVRDGLERAAHKLPSAEQAVGSIAATIELEAAAGGELSSRRIGELCLAGLRDADTIAYLRFATVHKQLADAEAIRAELRALDLAEALRDESELAALVGSGEWGPDSANEGNLDLRSARDERADAQDLKANEPGREIHA